MTPPKLGGGVEITSVTTGGGADKAGVKIGDVITKVDATSIEGDNAFRELFTEKKSGDVVTLSVKRGKDTLEIRATLANEERPIALVVGTIACRESGRSPRSVWRSSASNIPT